MPNGKMPLGCGNCDIVNNKPIGNIIYPVYGNLFETLCLLFDSLTEQMTRGRMKV